ncbi:D-alanine--D-alanine ligase family protein [Enterococcus alishanensis]
MKIIILAGGLSPERNVSISSSVKIQEALNGNGHQTILLDIAENIKEYSSFEEAYSIYSKRIFNVLVSKEEPDLTQLKKIYPNEIGQNILSLCKKADLCYLGLHGGIGEGGKLQALLDIHQIKYTGSGSLGSGMAMDKNIAKQIMVANDILTPQWCFVSKNDIPSYQSPCVIKQVDNGSSIGVELAENNQDYLLATEKISRMANQLMIEEKINGREFSVGILGSTKLPAIEIIPKKGFYDYSHKYQSGATTEITPAKISNELASKMGKIALKTHKILKLQVYSRIDFIVTNQGEIYCIEANSLPGMTPTSLLPQEAAADGINFNQLCETIVDLSLNKY